MAAPRTMAVDDAAVVADVVAVLLDGGIVVLPTDTVYGVAALSGHEDRLAECKGRPSAMPIAVLVADAEQAWSLARKVPDAARALAAEFWPGPLTLVLPDADVAGATIGVRCPDHDLVRLLAARLGPLPTTSANRHGEATPDTAAAAAASLVVAPDLVVDGGPAGAVASTVLDVSGSSPIVLREGAIPSTAIAEALR